MTILYQSHSGREKAKGPSPLTSFAAPPAGTDIAVDEQADFGYFVPPQGTAENYLPESPATVGELDELGNRMIDAAAISSRCTSTGRGAPTASPISPASRSLIRRRPRHWWRAN